MFDRFRAASSGQQIQMIVAVACLVGILLAALWFSFFRTVYQPLFSGLRAPDAATITAELDKKKIPYRLADGGATILVPAEMVNRTRLDVAGGDMPLKGTVGFELFDKSDMGLTDFAQKINYQRALQGELERTIMSLDGVEMARVHLSLGEDHLFRDDSVAPKASVTIRMAKGIRLSGREAQGITRLVAAAVPKLDASEVVILDEFGQVVGTRAQGAWSAASTSPLQQEQSGIQEYYEAIIRSALVHANVPAGIGVNVAADIGPNADVMPGQGGLPTWDPATRGFPLTVTLSPVVTLDPQERQAVITVVTQAIASTSATADMVQFGASPLPVGPAPIVQVRKEPAPSVMVPMADDESNLVMAAAVTLMLFLLTIAGLVMLLRRLRAPRRLGRQRRADFAIRLQKLLEERQAHAASRS